MISTKCNLFTLSNHLSATGGPSKIIKITPIHATDLISLLIGMLENIRSSCQISRLFNKRLDVGSLPSKTQILFSGVCGIRVGRIKVNVSILNI